jgi:hypothetical protein
MTGIYGIAILLVVLGLGKAARRFKIGPTWLRSLTLNKYTYY